VKSNTLVKTKGETQNRASEKEEERIQIAERPT